MDPDGNRLQNIWVCEFTGLDYWSGLLDWSTGALESS